MKTYQVWSEGYAATGDSGGAINHGSATASSFKDACKRIFRNNNLFDEEQLTYWGCRLFDNREDAQRSFG